MSDNEHAGLPEQVDPAKMWFRYRRYPFLLAKVAFFGAIAYGIFLCLRTVDAVLFPILVSMLIAYLLDPTIDWAEEKGVNRTLAILIFIMIGGAGAALFVLVLYPTFANSIASVLERLPQVGALIEDKFIPWVETSFGYSLPPTISEAVTEYRDQIQQQIPNLAQKATGWAGGLLTQTGAIVASILNLVMIPIFSFYFLRDFDKMRLSLVEYIPVHRREVILDRVTKMDTVVGAWFRGQINVALILAVLYSIGLGSIFGASGMDVTSGVAVGLLTGLLNIIPYFGVLIGVILSVLLVLIEWTGPGPLIGVAAVFLVVQLLEGYIITPKIVGEAVGLSPVLVIIVLLLGGELLGLMGVLLAIPIAGVVKVLLPDIIALYRESPFYTGEFRPEAAGPGYESVEAEPPPEVRTKEEIQASIEKAMRKPSEKFGEGDEPVETKGEVAPDGAPADAEGEGAIEQVDSVTEADVPGDEGASVTDASGDVDPDHLDTAAVGDGTSKAETSHHVSDADETDDAVGGTERSDSADNDPQS